DGGCRGAIATQLCRRLAGVRPRARGTCARREPEAEGGAQDQAEAGKAAPACPRHERARASDRSRRSGAQVGRGRAVQSGRVVGPGEDGQVNCASRGRQAGGGGALRTVGASGRLARCGVPLALMTKNILNIVIVLVLAALVVAIPGGGTGASIAIQAVSLAFLASLVWFASIKYRQHRAELYALGDNRRLALYGAVGVGAVTLTATHRLWQT